MHLSRGAKTPPDLNIHGEQTEEGETKVSLPPGSDTPGGKSRKFSAIMEKHDSAFSLFPPSSVPPRSDSRLPKQEETSAKANHRAALSELSVEPERGNAYRRLINLNIFHSASFPPPD